MNSRLSARFSRDSDIRNRALRIDKPTRLSTDPTRLSTNPDPSSQHSILSNPIDIASLEAALLKEEAEMALKTASLEAALKAEAEASAARKQELALQLRKAKEAAQDETTSGEGLVTHVATQAKFHALLAQCLDKATPRNVNTLLRSWNLEMERYLERIDRDGVEQAPLALSYHEDLAVFGDGSVKKSPAFTIEQLGELAKEWEFNLPRNAKPDQDPREYYGFTAEGLAAASNTSQGLRKLHAAQIVAAGAKRTDIVTRSTEPSVNHTLKPKANADRYKTTKTYNYCSSCDNTESITPFAGCYWKQAKVKKDGKWVAEWDTSEGACANCVYNGDECSMRLSYWC